ncbi:TetR/AcrR family transcriptional regulator [Mycolicibacterium austroafricanum]|uniref:TetR/AcrR family transcriptional regulator n=1 Tax=Mycolicibacterium austroafricanum TaxID=39687 RepID=UPI001CA321E6|nr:TetR/AcrR family transcriptional regulator [Mycolicibacterium austroafricanum]QZT58608.1 TetR/AcrR family transcriptional regulator [Mycolicibacterium austroafricanum]
MARAGLGRDAVVRAAVQIADTEGIDALSMRRVSQELGVTPMALYRYLPDKSGLVDVVVDESLRDVPLVDPTRPVTGELLRCFGGLYELLVAHPGLARAVGERPLEGPVATRIGDRVLTLLQQNGVGRDDAANLLVAAFSLALGSALYRTSRSGRSGWGFRRSADAPAVDQVRGRLAVAAADDVTFRDAFERLVRGYLIAECGPSAET